MPKAGKNSKGSSTPGRSKGTNCQRSQLKNMYCLDSRLYRTNPALYEKCCVEVGQQKGNYPYKPQNQ
jgi:hypothetical protein